MGKTHKTHWTVPELPWKRAKVSKEAQERINEILDDELEPLPYGQISPFSVPPEKDLPYCHCGIRGKYYLHRWYCQECWDIGDDEW